MEKSKVEIACTRHNAPAMQMPRCGLVAALDYEHYRSCLLNSFEVSDLPAFCAGYFAGDMLFELGGLQGPASPVPGYVANTFAVLTRGAPTRPSPKLKSLLAPKQEKRSLEWDGLFQTPLFLVNDSARVWDQTVRGAPDGYNPALEFFDAILPIQLPAWAFIRQLLIPEYPLFRSLGAPGNLMAGPNDEQVDFFLPQADLVIEIDGGTHRETRQAWKDKNRDRFLERFGILTLRLDTADLRTESTAFHAFFARLRQRCEDRLVVVA